jgi:glycosyltransferase involved in cell wall biosynthesis
MVGWNTLALARIARESGARVVLSAHDMAMMCGDYNMMAPGDAAPCGRTRARGDDAGCVSCLRGKSAAPAGVAPTVARFIEERHAAAADALAATDAIVCPSRFAADRVHAAFGGDVQDRCRVIGHGVARAAPLERHPERPMLTVAFVGRFTGRKGSTEVLEAARLLAGRRILIEVHGPCDDPLAAPARAAGIVLRGPYDPTELPERLRGVDLVIAPSILEETYCLVASEAQMLGIPIVASRQGAPPERIREGETGFLVPPGDAAALTELLLRLRDDRPRLEAVAARLRVERPATIESNVAEYLAAGANPPASFDGGDDEERIGRAFNLPRVRRCTPLGDEGYDRWLEREALPLARSTQEPALIRFAAGSMQEDLGRLNRAIAAITTEWVAFAQDGDTLAPGALAALADAVAHHRDAELLYTDDDVVSSRGERYEPAFKPAFDPELLRHHPYIAGLCAVRKQSLLARGGLDASGWLGVIGFALQLAEEHGPGKMVRVPIVGVRRLEANLRALEDEAFASAFARRTAEHLRRTGGTPMWLAPADDAPAMWAYAPVRSARVSALVIGASSPAAVDACIAAMVHRCGGRLAEIFIDLPAAQATGIVERHARGGALPILSIGQPALGHALLRASTPWLVVADARCGDFTPGWLDRLEQGIAGDHVAAIAPYLRQRNGVIAPGWEVVGGGPWAVAGAAPQSDGSRQSALLHTPRQVGALAGRLLLVRRDAAITSGALNAIEGAGPWQVEHLTLALRSAGHVLVSRPYVAAALDGHASPPVTRDPVGPLLPPPAATWMRERWGERLKTDPFFPAELALDEERPRPAPRFTARRGGGPARLCAFPFDRGGSGEMRVRQPCEALAAAGHCELVTMPEHDTGVAPNALTWERLDADVMYALNFFHDAQLRALDAGAPRLRVLGMDDLLTDLPLDNPFARTIYPDIADRIRLALERCDRLVVSTPALARAYGPLAREVRVIPNAIDLTRWPEPPAPIERKRLRVGWAGAAQHLHDLRLIAPVVEATADEFDWVFFGLCPPEMRAWAAEVHPMVPVRRYPARLARLGFDVAVAPLVDHPFNRAKSALKLLEYGALALPVVASDIEPYHDAPVIRAGDDPEAWIEALRSIAHSPDRGRERGLGLHSWVKKTGTLQVQIASWSAALELDSWDKIAP